MDSETYSFERLSMGKTFGRVTDILKKNLGVFLPLSAVTLFPMMMVVGTFMHVMVKMLTSVQNQEMPAILEHASAIILLVAIEGLFYLVTSTLGRGAMIHSTAEVYLGRKPSWCNSLRQGLSCFCSLLGAVLIYAGALLAGYFVFLMISMLVGMIFGYSMASQGEMLTPDKLTAAIMVRLLPYLILWLAYATYFSLMMMITFPVIMLEGKPAVASIARALELMSGSWCYLFCHYFVFSLVTGIVGFVVHLILGGANSQNLSGLVVASVVGYLPQLVFLPYFNILQTVLYVSLRVEKEGMNKEVLLTDMGPARSTSSSSGQHQPLPTSDTTYSDEPLLNEEDLIGAENSPDIV